MFGGGTIDTLSNARIQEALMMKLIARADDSRRIDEINGRDGKMGVLEGPGSIMFLTCV